jgi:predicted transcriptional regulator
MVRKPAPVTETELAIMDVLWQRGPTTVREVVEAVYRDHSPSLHATVKSLLDRLAEKGYVLCDKGGFAHRFSARVDRETFVGRQLQRIADSHFGGSLSPMLLTLLARVKLSPKERETIRRIVEGIE